MIRKADYRVAEGLAATVSPEVYNLSARAATPICGARFPLVARGLRIHSAVWVFHRQGVRCSLK